MGGDMLGLTPLLTTDHSTILIPLTEPAHTSKLAPKAIGKQTTRKAIAKNYFFIKKLNLFCIHTQKSKYTIANQYFTS